MLSSCGSSSQTLSLDWAESVVEVWPCVHNSFRMERHFLHSDKADIITPVKLKTPFLPAHTDLHYASGLGLEWCGHSEVPELPRTCGALSATAILFPDPGNFRAADLPKSSGKHLLLNNQNSEKTFQSHDAHLWRFRAGTSSLLNQGTISRNQCLWPFASCSLSNQISIPRYAGSA